jgi:uncharacterized protein (TIGR03437 family)
MKAFGLISLFLMFSRVAFSQAPNTPVVKPRGIVNTFSKQPAPSPVAPGALLSISGFNLGPAIEISATTGLWPTSLGDPPVQVSIGGISAPISSVSFDRVVVQVPWDVAPGVNDLVVSRGGVPSRPAPVLVQRIAPSLRTSADSGFGEAAGVTSLQTVTLSATGLGSTNPPPLIAYVGGLPAQVSAALSAARVGEFDVTLQAPPAAKPGDAITLFAGGASANKVTWQKLAAIDTTYSALPPGSPDLQSLIGSDLRGNYAIAATGADGSGCASGFLLDLPSSRTTTIDGCLTTTNQFAQVMAVTGGSALASLIGPSGSGSIVKIFNPGNATALTVQLPSPASGIQSTGDGRIAAALSSRTVAIDPQTGDVQDYDGVVVAGPVNLSIDLGNGLNQVLSQPSAASDGSRGVVVGDDQLSQFKFASVDPQGKVIAALDFPAGWAPLVAPLPVTPNGPGPVNGPGPATSSLRVTLAYDSQTNRFYVISKKSDNSAHAVIGFALDGSDSAIVTFPEAWFAAACAPRIPLYATLLARTMVIPASTVAETAFKVSCPATGFAVFDPASQRISVVPLPSQGQINISQGGAGVVGDYVYATNGLGSGQTASDTLFYYDSLSGSVTALPAPAGIVGFGFPSPIAAMNAVLATAQNQRPGDAGFILFNLDDGQVKVLPAPEGFASVSLLSVLPITRKLAARGSTAGDASSNLVIYDLLTGDASTIRNPDGVKWVASLPNDGGGGGGLVTIGGPGNTGGPSQGSLASVLGYANANANTALAICFSSDRKVVGALGVRAP